MNPILAYQSWTTKQHLHLHTASDDQCEGQPIGPPALEVYLHESATSREHMITNRLVTSQPIPEPYIPSSPTLPNSPAEHHSPLRDHEPQRQSDTMPVATGQQVPTPHTTHHIPKKLPAAP